MHFMVQEGVEKFLGVPDRPLSLHPARSGHRVGRTRLTFRGIGGALCVLAPFADFNAKRPSLEGHKHATKCSPRDRLAVDDKQRYPATIGLSPFNSARDFILCDVRPFSSLRR